MKYIYILCDQYSQSVDKMDSWSLVNYKLSRKINPSLETYHLRLYEQLCTEKLFIVFIIFND